jgi:glycosyltransferase involved in cell wall biosynthesis
VPQHGSRGDELKVSVVIPCFQAETTLKELCNRLEKTLSEITSEFEIILVEDGSNDSTWEVISQITKTETYVHGIKLSRNFGQHNAITAGLVYSTGDWIVVMDCDLQDRPEEIIKFYRKTQEGYQVVVGVRNIRNDKLFKRLSSLAFYSVFQKMTGSKFDKRLGNFGLYSRKVINSVLELKEQHRSFGLLVLWVGFSRAEINIQHDERGSGRSTYKLTHRTALALDSIVSHTNKLLYIAIKSGLVVSATSLLFVVYLIGRFILFGVTTQGWTSLVISIFFALGVLLAAVGLLGIYVGKVFNETKARPIYIIEAQTDKN